MPRGVFIRRPVPTLVRFESKYVPEPNTGCWLWIGGVNRSGYGLIKRGGSQLAHRVAWELFIGPVPAARYVLHKCDTPSCVNPEHLYVGTQVENMDDMMRRGRSGPHNHPERMCRGETNRNAKLTAEDVRMIRALLAHGAAARDIARNYGVSDTTVRYLRDRITWRHVP